LAYNGWEPIGEPLGKGGQGTVYKARSPKRVEERQGAMLAVRQALTSFERRVRMQVGAPRTDLSDAEELVKGIAAAIAPDDVRDLGALKVFHMPEGDPAERDKTIGRLQAEVKALREINNPAILKLLGGSHLSVEQPFIVTEYFPDGTLHENLWRFKGRPLDALLAFRPLVEAIVQIHSQNAVHRDIKPKNIFVSDGRLVLGDFGIVIFTDAEGRLTETYGRAGSRDWMAPWFNLEHRFAMDEINPTLDIFPLGKVLWCLVSGRHQLQLWYFDRPAQGSRPANNLEVLFPDDPAMVIINSILRKCVVEEEKDCLKTAAEVLTEVDRAISTLRLQGQRIPGALWRCRVCGVGRYVQERGSSRIPYEIRADVQEGAFRYSVFVCDTCKSVQFFRA
jgi:serine/threonine protein kinase